jgi:predicted ferric reductase
MGVVMKEKDKKHNTLAAIGIYIGIFIGIPFVLYTLANHPSRSLLKESISGIIILAFFMMVAQFYLARSNKKALTGQKMSGIIKVHKVIGYFAVVVLLVHPFLIVVPRYFEAGIDPMDAFTTIITSFQNKGIVLGIIAWFLMLLLGLSSMLRNKLPMKFKTWRIFHGILSIVFLITGFVHIHTLGRHMDKSMSIYLVLLTVIGILLLLKSYFIPQTKK